MRLVDLIWFAVCSMLVVCCWSFQRRLTHQELEHSASLAAIGEFNVQYLERNCGANSLEKYTKLLRGRFAEGSSLPGQYVVYCSKYVSLR